MISFFDVKRSVLYVGINIKKGGKDGKDTLDTYLNLNASDLLGVLRLCVTPEENFLKIMMMFFKCQVNTHHT